MRSHEIDYEIIGNSMPVVEIHLEPEETDIAKAGALTYMDRASSLNQRWGMARIRSRGSLAAYSVPANG